MREELLFYGLLLALLVAIYAEESPRLESPPSSPELLSEAHATEKRYLAALAKNGRLPKFAHSKKRQKEEESSSHPDEGVQSDLMSELSDSWQEQKRHVGAFLKSRGRPVLAGGDKYARHDRSSPFSSSSSSSSEAESKVDDTLRDGVYPLSWDTVEKRNVATLARLGRLNAVRFGRFQPEFTGGNKRVMYVEEPDEGRVINDIDASDCEEEEENEEGNDGNEGDNYTNSQWIQKKRYIAALARSGRLPVWHTQKSRWGGKKRDTPPAYWLMYRSGIRPIAENHENDIGSFDTSKTKVKRCKRRSDDTMHEEKKNLAMLARKGLLPIRPYVPA